MNSARVLVLGASGCIGSQLVPVLMERGYRVRAAGKVLAKFQKYPWAHDPRLEIIETDVLDKGSLQKACLEVDFIYYLVHSMDTAGHDFEKADREGAINTAACARNSGVKRIIYLGGLGEKEKTLSKHLRSRMEVLHILHSGAVPTTTLRAAMIIGRGSVSFEVLCSLVKRLKMIPAPWWISTVSQPIAASNVVHYLMGCLELEATQSQIFDIGGPEVISYRKLMDIYAQEAGLGRRWIIPLPPQLILPLGILWSDAVSSYPTPMVRHLVEGLRNELVCQDSRIKDLIPQSLLDCRQAVRMAMAL